MHYTFNYSLNAYSKIRAVPFSWDVHLPKIHSGRESPVHLLYYASYNLRVTFLIGVLFGVLGKGFFMVSAIMTSSLKMREWVNDDWLAKLMLGQMHL
jgi:hypothetical protein